jgi:sugar phosphate isomerase/epimerase
MQIGIFAKTFATHGATKTFAAARAAGYETVQFNMACAGLSPLPDEISTAVTASIAKAGAASNVGIAAVSATYNMIHPDVDMRRRGQKQFGVIAAAARAMGTSVVTLCTGSRDPVDQWKHHDGNRSPEAWRDLCLEMEQAIAIAEKHDVVLCIEPELANVVCDAKAALRLIAEMKSPHLRVILDPANLFEHGPAPHEIIAHAIDALAPHLVMAHAKDRNAAGQVVAPGDGVIDFADFIMRLQRAGFDGPLVTHGLAESDAARVSALLKSMLSS